MMRDGTFYTPAGVINMLDNLIGAPPDHGRLGEVIMPGLANTPL